MCWFPSPAALTPVSPPSRTILPLFIKRKWIKLNRRLQCSRSVRSCNGCKEYLSDRYHILIIYLHKIKKLKSFHWNKPMTFMYFCVYLYAWWHTKRGSVYALTVNLQTGPGHMGLIFLESLPPAWKFGEKPILQGWDESEPKFIRRLQTISCSLADISESGRIAYCQGIRSVSIKCKPLHQWGFCERKNVAHQR